MTDAELLALVVPIVASAVVMLVAWLEVRSVVRRRQKLKQQRGSGPPLEPGGDVLLEISPDMLLQARGGDRPRYFVRAGALKQLIAENGTSARPDAAE